MFRCRDVGQLLYEFVEQRLELPVSQQLEQHLADCPGCLAFINTYKQTMHLASNLRCRDIPPELQQKLRSFIKTKLPPPRPSFWDRFRSRLSTS
ncbi:MAG: zf-HC2 domain-containing protein [Candidatus Omnitrophica bacterium]|nr:zf-HC2 domain-containing protein [Candidatus Omnitrophota bacterium]